MELEVIGWKQRKLNYLLEEAAQQFQTPELSPSHLMAFQRPQREAQFDSGGKSSGIVLKGMPRTQDGFLLGGIKAYELKFTGGCHGLACKVLFI